ncbi:MAG: DUF2057 family protein [Pseudomonadota bacterium]
MKPMAWWLSVCLLALPAAVTAGKKGPMYAVPDADRSRTDLATLVLPESVDIEMVDGLVYPGFRNLFRRGDLEVRILPGEREIAVRYNQLFEWGDDQHEVVRSKVIVAGFRAEPGKTYRVTHEPWRRVEEARKGVVNFTVRVLDEQGNNIVSGAAQISRNWKGEETITRRTDLVSPDAAAAALAAQPPAAPVAAGGAFESLKFIWQNAGEADRAAFRAWIAEPPPQ